LLIDATILQTAFPRANALTAAQCDRYCQELMERRQMSRQLSDRVRHYLRERGQPVATLSDVAAAFNLSERSLRRLLQQEGVGWRQLRDEILAEYARKQLRIGRWNIQQVGEQLGYADASSFSHAFKRWTGVSPAEFRREQPT